MKKGFLLIPFLLLTACATQNAELNNYVPGTAELVEYIEPEKNIEVGELITNVASIALGTPYRRGSMSLDNGFDCSGLVKWTFNHFGVDLPRTAREQSKFGMEISKDQLKEGDIVNFYSKSRGYHSGIYIGNNSFIHSPSKKDVVKITSLDNSYFKKYYIGARRVEMEQEFDAVEIEKKVASIKQNKIIDEAKKIAQNSKKSIKKHKA